MEMKKSQKLMIGIVATFILISVIQNILTVKVFNLNGVSLYSGAFLIGWIAFACSDIITEIMGEKFGRKCAIGGMIANLSWALICTIVIAIPSFNQEAGDAFALLFSCAWRITIASAIAYFMGSFVNNVVMDKLHKNDGEQKYYKRAILSTVAGQAVDDYVFYILAFAPIGMAVYEMDWKTLLWLPAVYIVTETAIEAIFTPLSKKVCDYIKKMIAEGN